MNKEKGRGANPPQDPFQEVFNKFKDNKKPDFKLNQVFEIYLPFWFCQTRIVIEKEVEVDRFSKVILQLIQSGLSKHSEICAFLGIDVNAFVTSQFHFLIKNGLIIDRVISKDIEYELHPDGIRFLENKTRIRTPETIDFEFYYDDMHGKLMDENKLISHANISEGKRLRFSGYQFTQTNRLPITFTFIPHKNKPYKIPSVEFASFYNQRHRESSFYNFETNTMQAHKRSVCFFALEYEDVNRMKYYEVRHSKKTSQSSIDNHLELELSDKVTEYFKKNPRTSS